MNSMIIREPRKWINKMNSNAPIMDGDRKVVLRMDHELTNRINVYDGKYIKRMTQLKKH